MKKAMVCFAAMMLVACGLCWAQTATEPTPTPIPPTPVPSTSIGDSEALARAFLSHEVVNYLGWFNFQRDIGAGGKPYWVSGNFSMTPDGWITNLVIDGVVIVSPGDKPLPGLPANKVGSAIWYNLGLNGLDDHRQFVINGNFSTKLLLPGDPIVVTLHPNNEERFIPFALPEGVDPNNLRIKIGDDIWSYDSQRGGFVVWLDPSVTITYEIFNAVTGEIYARGTIRPGGSEGSDGANIVGTNYYGVSALLLSESEGWGNLQDAMFDNLVERDGMQIPAKVLMTRAFTQTMWVQANDLPSDGRIEVRAWAPAGKEMPLIATADAQYVEPPVEAGKGGGYGYYYAVLETPPGYDKLVITITGTSNGQPFGVYLSRGGGKG